MTYEQLADLARDAGFTNWAKLDVSTIDLKQEVRDMCAVNTCGMYNKRWSCPPGCGTLEECTKNLKSMSHGILVQTVGDVEDGFDIEAMAEIEVNHKAHFNAMHQALLKLGIPILALGAGCCTKCKECTYPDAPCRFPKEMVSSMEAYGMLVLEVCKANGLKYYYGSDKMSYNACFLVKDSE